MKCGSFPGQAEALARRIAQAQRVAHRRARRRRLLLLGLGGLVGSLGTLGVTACLAKGIEMGKEEMGLREPPRHESSRALDWARERARGPLGDLLDVQREYAIALHEAEHIDDVLWIGLVRLTEAVIDSHPHTQPGLPGLLQELARRRDIPALPRQFLELLSTRAE